MALTLGGLVRGALAVTGAIALAAAGCSREGAAPDGTSGARAPFDESKLVDLTYPFDSTTLYWSPEETFRVETVSRGMTPGGYWYASNRFCASEHGGTHLDAPSHFGEGKSGTDAIPLARLTGPACVVDVSTKCAQDPD
ncbi:MAG TPA: cyclase family protein, partial [Candidatus Eisenbacteria bacterium]|nr:cyclase family protein [Candidatus Eisenbacteria bacterium]